MIARARRWYDNQNQLIQTGILLITIFIIRTFVFGLYQVPSGSMETTMLVGERFIADKFTPLFKTIKRGEIISFNDPNYAYSDNRIINLWQHYVWGPSNWTKRVIGIPGDHIQGVIEEGKPVVYLNGKKLDEPYLNKYPIIALWTSKLHFTHGYWIGENSPVHRSYDPAKPYNEQPFYQINPHYIVNHPQIAQILYPQTPGPQENDVFDVTLRNNEYWVMGDNRLGSWDSRGWGKLNGNLIHGKIVFRIFSFDTPVSPVDSFLPWTDWILIDLVLHPIEWIKRIRWSRCLQFVA
ncbi:MAG: signal peptidase I [Candidatus Babeliaceae bacterium]